MADAATVEPPEAGTTLTLTSWSARRSGAAMTVEGLDAQGRKRVVTGVTRIDGRAGGAVAVDGSPGHIVLA